MKKFISEHKIVSLLLLLGVALVAYRLYAGLGAVSGLSDHQPWGLVKAVNILSGAALSAGSFVIAAMVWVFGMRRFEPVARPALLMGFVGHTAVLSALIYDVGRPYDVWRILIDPQPSSVMLWTFACEAVYTTAVIIEILPEFAGTGRFRALNRVKGPVVVLSAAVAVVYQGMLGSLYIVSPHRVAPLWYGPMMPVLFLLSAVAAGLGMVVVEAYMTNRAGRRSFDVTLMDGIGRLMAAALWIYIALRVYDLAVRGGISALGRSAPLTGWFAVEFVAGFVIPAILLAMPSVRREPRGMFLASAMVALGVVMNRLGVAVIGWTSPPGDTYLPSLMEAYASFFFLLAAAAAYMFLSRLEKIA